MKKLLKAALYSAYVFLAGVAATPVIAGSAEFAGPYIAIQGAANGAAADGSGTNNNSEVTNGTMGKVFGSAGVQLGWSLPLSDAFMLGIDITHQPGDGKISLDSGAGAKDTATDINLTIGDLTTFTLMPMISVSDSSAVYIKYGRSHAGTSWSGDVTTDLNTSIRGTVGAIGTRSLYSSGVFIQTEFGVNDFGEISVMQKSTGTGTGKANPKVVYGAVSLGIRF